MSVVFSDFYSDLLYVDVNDRSLHAFSGGTDTAITSHYPLKVAGYVQVCV